LARKKEGKKKRGGISNKPKVPDYQRNHAWLQKNTSLR
jgi:hypothetical protein